MFSRNGQYIINELQEDTFDKQLPSKSIKISFKREKQKIFGRIQQKYQIQLLKEHIHQKCKAEQLAYLDQLQKERQRFYQMKQQEEKKKKQYILNFVRKKYQIQKQDTFIHKNTTKTQQFIKDSIDAIKQIDSKGPAKSIQKIEFSLEPSKQKQVEKIEQNQWVRRVMQGRKLLQGKFGKYYQKEIIKKDSDSDSSQDAK